MGSTLSFSSVLGRYRWTPLRHCPGRYVLRRAGHELSPTELLGDGVKVVEYRFPGMPDVVLVARFAGGGTISFRKPNGAYVHTLNTTEGLARRLARWGLDLPPA